MRSLCHGIGFENRRAETVATALPSCNNRRLFDDLTRPLFVCESLRGFVLAGRTAVLSFPPIRICAICV
jgi:hypothetical protein